MRIDLPQCGFKYCRYSFDGNCTNKNRYETCEYQADKMQLEELMFSNEALRRIMTFLQSEREEEIKAEAIKEFVQAIEKRLEHNWDANWEVFHSVMGSIQELSASRGVDNV